MSSYLKDGTLFISLVPLKIIAIFMIIGPWIAVYSSYALDISYLGIAADEILLYSYSAYAIVLIACILWADSKLLIKFPEFSEKKIKKYRARLLFISIFALMLVFGIAGRHILSGDLGRGDIRVELGFLGPIYDYTVKFALPTIVFCNFLLSKFSSAKGHKWTLLIYFNILFAAFMTGYKSTAIMVFLPLACCLWPSISSGKKIVLGLLALAFIIGSDLLVGENQNTLMESFNYSIARATSVAAYGLLGSWDFATHKELELTPIILNSIFGNHIGSIFMDVLGGLHGSQMFSDLAQIVTYEYYPDTDRAASGAVNLTLTLFGELVLISRHFWAIGVFIFICTMSFMLQLLKKYFYYSDLRMGILIFIFFNFIVLPLINSGGIFSLISLPTVVYLFVTYLLLGHILPNFRGVNV